MKPTDWNGSDAEWEAFDKAMRDDFDKTKNGECCSTRSSVLFYILAAIALVAIFAFATPAEAADKPKSDPWAYVKIKTGCANGFAFAVIKSATQIRSHQIFDQGKAIPCVTREMQLAEALLKQEVAISKAKSQVIEAYKDRVKKTEAQFKIKFKEQEKLAAQAIANAEAQCKKEGE